MFHDGDEKTFFEDGILQMDSQKVFFLSGFIKTFDFIQMIKLFENLLIFPV